MKKIVFLIFVVGCGTVPNVPETERQYVQSHHCTVDNYIHYENKGTIVYTPLNGEIALPDGGFTAYKCPNGVRVYIDFGK
jgi:hypothetical protein